MLFKHRLTAREPGGFHRGTQRKNELSTLTQVRLHLLSIGGGCNLQTMSAFKVNVIARNPKREELSTQPIPALVDTGSELTWLPGNILIAVGITPRRKRIFATATQEKVEREVGYAILSAEGYETNDEVVFAQPGDLTLLGVRTLEGFGVAVDNIAHRFVATTTLVAISRHTNLS
jgi:predicted aspartyl protease